MHVIEGWIFESSAASFVFEQRFYRVIQWRLQFRPADASRSYLSSITTLVSHENPVFKIERGKLNS